MKITLTDLLLVNSKPMKTKTGELILPCYTPKGKKYFSERLPDVRVCDALPMTTPKARLSAIRETHTGIDLLVKTFGLEVPKAKKSK